MHNKNTSSKPGHSQKVAKSGTGKARQQNTPQSSRPVKSCLCPNCGTKVPNTEGISCMTMICPQCGSQMMRG